MPVALSDEPGGFGGAIRIFIFGIGERGNEPQGRGYGEVVRAEVNRDGHERTDGEAGGNRGCHPRKGVQCVHPDDALSAARHEDSMLEFFRLALEADPDDAIARDVLGK